MNPHTRRGIFIVLTVFTALAGLGIFLRNYAADTPLTNITKSVSSPKPQTETLTSIVGTTSLIRNGQKTTLLRSQTASLTHGDIITTDQKSFAVINYQQNTQVRLGPQTDITFSKSEESAPLIQQRSGSLFVRFKKILGVRDAISVQTPTALASVRGSAFAVFVAADGQTKVISIQHSLTLYKMDEVSSTPATATETPLPEGKQMIILPGPITADRDAMMQMSDAQLTEEEQHFISFNKATMDMDHSDPIFAGMAAEIFAPTPTSTPTPTPSPTPTNTPTPTPSAVPKPTSPPLPQANTMPGQGYSRTQVTTDNGTFTLTCVGAAKGTRVITDAGNDSTCAHNCTVLPLAEYAKRNNGFAAINGMYFCPADYDWCKDKVNSFDTLFFNSRSRQYLNGDNNIYSTIPFLAIESNGNPIFKRHSYEWGRDTGIMAGTAGNPLMIHGGRNITGEQNLDAKMTGVKSARGAFVQKGDTIYLCVVAGATVPDAAKVYEKLGADNAINLDSGGSTALWVNGSYVYGPGRSLPTAIIFAR